MLALIFATCVIFFLLVSLGDFGLMVCSRFFPSQARYNLLDKYLIGLCFLLIPLQLWSIFLPSGILFFCIFCLFAVGYCIIQKDRVKCYFNLVKTVCHSLSWWQLLFIMLFIVGILLSCSWTDYSYDSEFYHYQSMFWAEQYPVIPGLVNLEDRYGFNSNYLLFSTIFSFNKGLLGEPLLAFNISFFIPMLIWVVVKNVRNKFEAKYIALLLVFSMLMILNTTRLSNTSTDFLANIIVFYLFAGVLLNKDIHSEKYLLYFSVPVLLLTFKISTAPLGLFCILILFFCYKKKEYKVFRFNEYPY